MASAVGLVHQCPKAGSGTWVSRVQAEVMFSAARHRYTQRPVPLGDLGVGEHTALQARNLRLLYRSLLRRRAS